MKLKQTGKLSNLRYIQQAYLNDKLKVFVKKIVDVVQILADGTEKRLEQHKYIEKFHRELLMTFNTVRNILYLPFLAPHHRFMLKWDKLWCGLRT